jgi:hypothetical protein
LTALIPFQIRRCQALSALASPSDLPPSPEPSHCKNPRAIVNHLVANSCKLLDRHLAAGS